MIEELEDIEKRKAELKEEIDTLNLKLELIARRSGRPRIDKRIRIIKSDLAKLNSEYIHLYVVSI